MSSQVLEGFLSKWTNVMKGWQFRWFVLEENVGVLSYYTSKEKMTKGVRRGCVRLKGAVVGIDDQDNTTFTITVDHKTFHFQARDSDEREIWVRRLEDTILRHVQRSRGYNWETSSHYSSSSSSSTKRSTHLEAFDKKVTEADAYLQLMIEKINDIDMRISAVEDPSELAKCNEIKNQSNAMLENIKHSIVLLQIAKNTVHPNYGSYHGPSIPLEPMSADFSSVQQGVAFGSDCLEDKELQPQLPDNANLQVLETIRESQPAVTSLTVPETSYSSSEGEDDFEDATDEFFTSSSNIRHIIGVDDDDDEEDGRIQEAAAAAAAKRESLTREGQGRRSGGTLPTKRDGSLDYDAIYEEESDSDSMSMESHGSVVAHLLSQVKIGMDLTKVVLPTFILERRSLLEMYADYFAHPDLFLKIADLPTPRDRMVQVVKWYLSSYHAGRKSTVAKKPYNPILGEIFQCHWNVPTSFDAADNDADDSQADVVPDGPVPWCKSNQLTFVAEQVSHHPPISAFYAENLNKKISFNAYVWTKSKFLGISIGVHNIGQGVVTVCDLNEEYILTFPNGYGRSILTVPWIELGGSVTINCPQTGYRSDIEFLTKPFYGGKRNRVTAEVYAPHEKKSFMSVSGDWSGLMEYKMNDGSKAKADVFVDVNEINIHPKNVRPIAEQEDYESRNIWKEVTAGLKLNDIERATNAKTTVEQKQRDEAKERKENGSTWSTRCFNSIGESWTYKNPLSQRLYMKEKAGGGN